MTALETASHIKKQRFVPILRTDDMQTLINVTRAVVKAGVRVMEYTMTTPGLLDDLSDISRQFPELIIGIGTVMGSADARTAIVNGAEFIVSPVSVLEMAHVVKSHDKLLMLGAMTPTEMWRAHEVGSDIVKIFPANVVGSGFIKDMKGPMPGIEIFMTGGIGLENAREYLDAGAAAIGLGGCLFKKEWIKNAQWDKITEALIKAHEVVRV